MAGDINSLNLLVITVTPTARYVQWTIPSLLYQTRRENPLVYKGLSSLLCVQEFSEQRFFAFISLCAD